MIEPATPYNRCVTLPTQGLARSSVELPEVWLLPELNRCRRVARGLARAGNSPLIFVGKGGKGGARTVCRDRAAELAACREHAARNNSSPLLIDTTGKGKRRRFRYVCKENGEEARHCESASGTSSPLLPIGGKPRGCADKDQEEKVCETTLRARGSQSPMFLAKGIFGPCKFTIAHLVEAVRHAGRLQRDRRDEAGPAARTEASPGRLARRDPAPDQAARSHPDAQPAARCERGGAG